MSVLLIARILDVLQMEPPENIDRIHHIVIKNRRFTMNQTDNALNICPESVILHNELVMTMVFVRWLKSLLTNVQKRTRMTISQ